MEKWLPQIDNQEFRLFYSLVKCDERLDLIPGEAEILARINILSGKEEYLEYEISEELRKLGLPRNEKDPFFGGFIYKGILFVMGASYPGLLKIDNDFRKIKYLSVIDFGIENDKDYNAENYFFVRGYSICGESVYIPFGVIPAIAEVSLCTDEIDVIRLPKTIKKIHGLVEHLGKILILTEHKDNCLYLSEWNAQSGITYELYISDGTDEKNLIQYWWEPFEYNGELFIFPMNRGKVYRVDYNKKTVQISEEIMDAIGEWPEFTWRYMITPIGCINDKLVFHTLWNRKFIEYDMNTGTIKNHLCIINDNEYSKRWLNRCDHKNTVISEKEFALEDFIKVI